MTSRRVLKAAEAIREVVSMTILTDLKDPRVRDVTVTYVEVSGDMRTAKVHVSVMGDETKQNLSLRGLQNSAGYFQHKIAKRIDMRYTPIIQFVLDKGVKHSIMVAQMLNDLLPKKDADAIAAEEASADDVADDEADEIESDATAEVDEDADSDAEGDEFDDEDFDDEFDEDDESDEDESDVDDEEDDDDEDTNDEPPHGQRKPRPPGSS